jgi:hypothetical protein
LLIPAAIFATVQATEDAPGPAASAATDATVHPANTAINRENSTFSKIRPKELVIFVLLIRNGGSVRDGGNVGRQPAPGQPIATKRRLRRANRNRGGWTELVARGHGSGAAQGRLRPHRMPISGAEARFMAGAVS